ncbi:MAG: hypothetical protein BGO41_09320 [Clostridiales bacterium 38-18]|nr:MAG: hypothetical protein BGO41_09320 [Clostridiales bacterium 38-18]
MKTNKTVLEGTWKYDNAKLCNLRIVKENTIYGTGDYEDPPEIREDIELECYYVEYESMVEKNRYCTRSQAYMSVADAIKGEEVILNQKIDFRSK